MDLRFDFSALWTEVHRLTDDVMPFSVTITHVLDPIDVALSEKGIDVDLGELESVGNLLTYHGRQILLYIPDHGASIRSVLSGESEGKKFHVAHCQTLEEMRHARRFERYVATTKLDGSFTITGQDRGGNTAVRGDAHLLVCKHCLSKLNYRQAALSASVRNRIRNEFDITEFFETYSSCFPHMPKRAMPAKGSGAYVENWREISRGVRAGANWNCSHCKIDLSDYRHLLHVHHVNGNKEDNARRNLRPLCAACHREQPLHSTLFVPWEDMQVITAKRRAIGALIPDWNSLLQYADPALRGLLGLARSRGLEPPEAGYSLPDSMHLFDLAWPWRKEAVMLETHERPNVPGWTILTLAEAMDWLG